MMHRIHHGSRIDHDNRRRASVSDAGVVLGATVALGGFALVDRRAT
jgi:hypothetical protein